MFKKIKRFKQIVYATLFVVALFFVQCSTSVSKENDVPEQVVLKDTVQAIDTKGYAALRSEITCPECNHKKTEVMPTEVCQLKYTCEKCQAVLYPKKGDCCVFCTYGDKKCPSMQD